MGTHRSCILTLHGAVMLMGLSAVLGRFLCLPAVTIAAGRVLCSSPVLLILAKLRKKTLRLDKRRDYGVALLAGLVLAAHWSTFFLSIQTSSVAVGTITFSAFPLFLTVLEPLIFREAPSRKSIVCALVLLAGVLITVPEFSSGNPVTVGVMWGMVSSFSYALLSLFNRYLSRKYPAEVVCLYQQGAAAVALLPAMIWIPAPWNGGNLVGILILGIVCTALAHSLYVAAQRRIPAQTAGIISGMETVYGIVYAMVFLGEFPTGRQCLGGAVILCASLVQSLGRQNTPDLACNSP